MPRPLWIGAAKRPVRDLREGDRVDLEADLFADPDYHVSGKPGSSEHPEFQFEFEVVARVVPETADCTLVEFESGFACGFPPDHLVDVDGEQEEN